VVDGSKFKTFAMPLGELMPTIDQLPSEIARGNAYEA